MAQRAVAYGRVSTKSEEGLDTQVFGITRLCENEGIELMVLILLILVFGKTTLFQKEIDKAIDYPTVWCDFGVSGGTMDRPMFA